MTTLLKVNNALCRVGRKAVLAVDQWTIEQGQHWCVFGPNGAGKTLLAKLISASRREASLYVSYGEGFDPSRDLWRVSFEEQQRLWQQDNRFDISEYDSRARDEGTTVSMLIQSARPAQEQDAATLAELLQALGLQALAGQGLRYLSSGQLRKAVLARALYSVRDARPTLLILDEPLESVDLASRQQVEQCMQRFLDQRCASVHLVRREADRPLCGSHLLLMDDLKILVQGPVSQIEQGDEYAALTARTAEIPAQLPRPVIMEDAAAEYDKASDNKTDKAGKSTVEYIQLCKVSAHYGDKQVFSGVDWSMMADQHWLIEGPNGCGKSTLLNLIDGENHMAYGQDVFLFGRRKGSGETIWELKHQFGVVSNELHNKYIRGWRVLDVVVSGFYDTVGLYDDVGASEVDHARQWLQVLGLSFLEKAYYEELSFGQQRLVLLARAMVKEPKVLILDEPCVGLDDYHRHYILALLDRIAEQTQTRLLYVSHVADEKPACITHALSFVADGAGGYELKQSVLS